MIDGLAPPDLGAAGLAESLRRYAVLAGRAHGVPVTFTAGRAARAERGPGGRALPGRAGGAAQRAAARGRRPDRRRAVPHPRGRVILEVTDDGSGFVPGAAGAASGCLDARTRRIGRGHADDPVGAGAGTTVRLAIPVAGRHGRADRAAGGRA